MKISETSMFEETILANIRKIMRDRNLTQSTLAEYMETSEGQFSKILSGKVKLSLRQLENLARALSLREIDIITYPVKYEEKYKSEKDSIDVVLQIKLKEEKKNQLLELVFGDSNIDIIQ